MNIPSTISRKNSFKSNKSMRSINNANANVKNNAVPLGHRSVYCKKHARAITLQDQSDMVPAAIAKRNKFGQEDLSATKSDAEKSLQWKYQVQKEITNTFTKEKQELQLKIESLVNNLEIVTKERDSALKEAALVTQKYLNDKTTLEAVIKDKNDYLVEKTSAIQEMERTLFDLGAMRAENKNLQCDVDTSKHNEEEAYRVLGFVKRDRDELEHENKELNLVVANLTCELEKLKIENEKIINERNDALIRLECFVCCENKNSSCAFLPCGHQICSVCQKKQLCGWYELSIMRSQNC
jgi:chromosome segregation ATPase